MHRSDFGRLAGQGVRRFAAIGAVTVSRGVSVLSARARESGRAPLAYQSRSRSPSPVS